MNYKQAVKVFVPVIALSLGGAARADFIQNGGFENTVTNNTHPDQATYGGQLNYQGLTADHWTNTLSGSSGNVGYTFLYRPQSGTSGTSADQHGVQGFSSNVKLWGPGTGVANGLTLSPNGGNFIAADPNYYPAALVQTINGLTVGEKYNVSFYWAGAQQSGFTGATTQWWQVSLGSETHDTAHVGNASKGFTGWMNTTLTFTATAASEQLSFLAKGTPSDTNLPPFVLLDGVSMNAVPEPSTVLMVGLGLAGLVGVGLRRRARVVGA